MPSNIGWALTVVIVVPILLIAIIGYNKREENFKCRECNDCH